jgi:hypothetical protein
MANIEPIKDRVLEEYEKQIRYYWRTSRHNKNTYKLTQSLVVILGAVVTLVASLASANFITSNTFWDNTFAIAAPVLAALLTIAGGFSQAFRWGATWRDLVLNAERLEKERDRISVMKPENLDPNKELAFLNDLVISETETFFQRILGGAKRGKET